MGRSSGDEPKHPERALRREHPGAEERNRERDRISCEAGNKASDSGSGGGDRRPAGNGSLESIAEFMGSGRTASAGEFDVPIVDAAVVQELFGRGKHRDFGSDSDFGEARKSEIGVAEGRETVTVIAQVLADLLRRFGFDWVEEKERRAARVMSAEVLDGWRIAIRNRAIRTNEKKHDDFRPRETKRIGGAAVKIQYGNARGLRKTGQTGQKTEEEGSKE